MALGGAEDLDVDDHAVEVSRRGCTCPDPVCRDSRPLVAVRDLYRQGGAVAVGDDVTAAAAHAELADEGLGGKPQGLSFGFGFSLVIH